MLSTPKTANSKGFTDSIPFSLVSSEQTAAKAKLPTPTTSDSGPVGTKTAETMQVNWKKVDISLSNTDKIEGYTVRYKEVDSIGRDVTTWTEKAVSGGAETETYTIAGLCLSLLLIPHCMKYVKVKAYG